MLCFLHLTYFLLLHIDGAWSSWNLLRLPTLRVDQGVLSPKFFLTDLKKERKKEKLSLCINNVNDSTVTQRKGQLANAACSLHIRVIIKVYCFYYVLFKNCK